MKKLISLLLVIAMLIPAFAMAATPEELLSANAYGKQVRSDISLSISPAVTSMLGNDPQVTAVVDLIDVLGLSVVEVTEANPGQIALTVSGHNFVNIDYQMINNDLYLASNLLNNALMVPLSQIMDSLTSLAGGMEGWTPDVTALTDAIMAVAGRATPVSDFVTPAGALPAAECIAIDLTVDDIIAVDSAMMDLYLSVPMLDTILATSGTSVAALKDELNASFEEMRAQMAGIVFPLRIYVTADGLPSAVTMQMAMDGASMDMELLFSSLDESNVTCTMTMAVNDGTTSVSMDMFMAMLTDSTTVSFSATQNGSNAFSVDFRQTRDYGAATASRVSDFTVTIPDAGTIQLLCACNADSTGNHITADLSVMGITLGGLKIEQYPVAPLASIDTVGATDITTIDDAQIQRLSQVAGMNLITALSNVLTYLPASVQNLIFGAMGN